MRDLPEWLEEFTDNLEEIEVPALANDSSNARQLGCVFQDMKPPKSILRKSPNMQRPIQRVKFTKAIARHTKIRDKNPSLGYICPGEPHQRSPNAPKFEDRSQEETEWQVQGAREAAWKLAKSVLNQRSMKEQHSSHLRKNMCLPASTLKPEEREFVVDSGASMHMISKKDLNDAEMDTLTKSCSPTSVITANGEVQTHEEATVHVKELEKLSTMKVLENTPAVLSLGKLCDENGYSYEWINGQKPHLIKNGIRIICNTENFVPIVVPGLSSSSSGSLSTSRTPSRQESHSSSYSSTSTSSPTVSEIQTREREDRIDISPVQVSNSVDDRSGRPDETQANKTQKSNKKETTIERGDPLCSDIPEWLQEFRENLVDDEIPVHGDSHANSSHEVSLEPTFKRREDLGKYSVYTHFPKDRNWEICKRTNMTSAPCRRRTGEAVHRAEKFGDLITADHKVLSEGCESRNDHRYAVVVQDLATQSQNKNFSGDGEGVYESFSSRQKRRKSSTLTIHWNLAYPDKIYHGIIELRHLIDLRRLVLRKCCTQSKGRNFCYEFREPTLSGNKPQRAKISVENFKVNRESLNRQNQQMTLKPGPTSCRFKVTSSIVITMNLEFKSTCQRDKHSPSH